MITATMKVADVLAAHPQTLEVFAAQHPAFGRLRSPALRKLFARLVSVEQAAGIAGIDVDHLLAALNAAGAGRPSPDRLVAQAGPDTAPPDWYDPARVSIILDVRSDAAPFAAISQAAGQLLPGEILNLRNSFEPLPLYEALGRRGFAHWAWRQADGDWLIFFRREGPGQPVARPASAAGSADPSARVVLDNRGLMPPEPMMRTLEALKTLPPNSSLLILTDRQPLLLYEALDEQGYAYQTIEASDNSYRTSITRTPAARGAHR
jgi:TusA-related sulfurtransferase